MSSSHGRIKHPETGEVLGHLQYQGTTDCCLAAIWPTPEDVLANWNKYGNEPSRCTCGGEAQEVEVEVDYAGGLTWDGSWCPTCKILLEGFNEHEWYEKYEAEQRNKGWWG